MPARGSGLQQTIPSIETSAQRPADRTIMDMEPPWFAQSDRPTVDLLASGSMVGEFRVEAFLGMGAMGTVYGAVHPVIGKRVAIKVLRRDLIGHSEAVGRFVREAQAASRVHHANVIDVFTYGLLSDGRAFFVMEWLEGETLRQRLGRPLVLADVVRIVDQAVAALYALHGQQVVHRDLKPDNVFLVGPSSQPLVKILDFGVAKLLDNAGGRERLTKAGFVVGTAEYSSPEQAGGHPVDARTDIYALGVMLFELLTGRRPFTGGSTVDLLVEHIVAPAPRVSSLRPTVPRELDQLVYQMMAKDAGERPTLAQVREVLARHAGSRLPVGPLHRSGPEQRTILDGGSLRDLPVSLAEGTPVPMVSAPIVSAPAARTIQVEDAERSITEAVPVSTPVASDATAQVARDARGNPLFAEPFHPEPSSEGRRLLWALVALAVAIGALFGVLAAR